jgi:type IV pilus assembly protein PilM
MAAVPLVGLDIGSMSIRAAETGRSKEGPTVTAFGAVPLPDGAVLAGVVQDEQAVTAALKHLWSTAKFRSRNVALGVTNPQVVVRRMALANLPAAELRRSLPFQVRDSLPLPVERSLLDFYPLGGGDGETIDGLLIASPKEAVLTAIRAIEKAGLHVGRVDLGSFALLRAASYLDTNVEALVDIGAQVTTVIAHADGIPLIVRTVPRGGSEITEALAGRLNIDREPAEDRKRKVGLNTDTDPEAAGVIREAVRPLINEIRSSFAYLNTGERAARVARVLLAGGGAQLPGLLEALSAQLNVEVSFADPLIRFATGRRTPPEALDRFRTVAAVSIGLTMGAA